MNLLPIAITVVTDNANGGFDHTNNHCTVGAADVHKVDDPPGEYFDGGDSFDDAHQGHLHAHWADATGPNLAEVRFKFQPIGTLFSVDAVKLFVRAWRSGGSYTGAEFRPYLWLRSDPGDAGTGARYYLDPATWEVPPAGGDIDGDWVKAPFGGPDGSGNYSGTNYVLNFGKINPATSAEFTRADLNVAEGGFFAKNDDAALSSGPYLGTIYLPVLATGAPDQQEQTREIASRDVLMHRRAPYELQGMPVKWSVSRGLRLGDILNVSHFAGPDESGLGWGSRAEDQKPFLITSIERRDDGHDLIGGIEWDELPILYCDSMLMKTNINPASEDGILRVGRGQGRVYSRVGPAWELDPGSGIFVRLEANERPYGALGLACFGEYTNYVLRSAMKDGDITGWTKNGAGTNGSSIVADTVGSAGAALGETLGWDKETTGIAQSVVMTAGTPHTADLYIDGSATAEFAANTKVSWQAVWTRYLTDQPGYGALRRIVDNKWLQLDGTWADAIDWFDLRDDNIGVRDGDPTGTVEAWTRGKLIDVGGSPTTLKPRIGLPTGLSVVDAQVTRFYLGSQITDKRLQTAPPIPTDDAAVTRSAGLCTISNDVGRRIQLAGQGGFGIRATAAWRGTEQEDNSYHYAWFRSYDDNNEVSLFFVCNRTEDGFSGWVLRIVSGGTAYESKISTVGLDVVPGLSVELVPRMNGAVRSPNLTASLFLMGMERLGKPAVIQIDNYSEFFGGGIAHKNDVAYVAPVETDASYLEIGSRLGLGHFDGHLAIFRNTARVPTNAQCVRFVR